MTTALEAFATLDDHAARLVRVAQEAPVPVEIEATIIANSREAVAEAVLIGLGEFNRQAAAFASTRATLRYLMLELERRGPQEEER